MRLEDFDRFKDEMRQLCAVYGRAFSTPMCQAYWRVLRPLPLEEFERTVAALLPRATSKSPFPRPLDLAGESKLIDRPQIPGEAAQEGEQRAIRNLEEMRARDPAAHRLEVARRHLDRILAVTSPDSPIYERALSERRAMGWGY
jgi:hypothetical protein